MDAWVASTAWLLLTLLCAWLYDIGTLLLLLWGTYPEVGLGSVEAPAPAIFPTHLILSPSSLPKGNHFPEVVQFYCNIRQYIL